MSKFILNSKLNFLLKNAGKPPLIEISFLGTGGAFDTEEKNSSVVIKTANGTILIDCGSTVYSELKVRRLINKIDYVFLTHCHEDHIGSLSTLIYHKYFGQKKQTTKIECIPSLKPKVEMYLKDVCGHMDDNFVINGNSGVLYKDLNVIIHKIETTGYHYENYPSAGFVFNFKKGGEDLFLIYSGDVNTPLTEIIKDTNPLLYESLVSVPENVFIFHESTSKDYSPLCPHCEYQKLEKTVEIFPNIYTYHHSQEETKNIIKKKKESRKKLDAIKKAIDIDLNKKLSLAKSYETQENLRIQAKRMKDEFTEEFGNYSMKVNDLSTIGNELVVQEKKGM